MKEHQGRIVGKAYFWIDLQRFCNVIKWRISDMRNKIDNSLKSVRSSPSPHDSRPVSPPHRNSITRAIYVLDVQSNTPHWKLTASTISLAMDYSAIFAIRSWWTTRIRKKSRAARIECRDLMLK
jgi:hypothetical protein